MSLFILSLLATAQAAPPSFVPDARFGLALYCSPTCSDELITALEAALEPIEQRRRLPRAAAEPLRSMGLVTVEDFGRPDLGTLGSLADGLDDAAIASIEASQEVLVVSFAAPRERIVELNAAAYPAVLSVVSGGDTVIEDLATGRLFDAASFAEQVGLVTADPLDTSAFFVLEISGDEGEPTDLETSGLRALGLHDMRIEDLSDEQLDDQAALINAVAQLAWEQGGLSSRMFVSEAAIQQTTARHRAVGIEGTVYVQSAQSSWSTSADPMVRLGFDGRFDADPADPLSAYPQDMVDAPEPEPMPEPEATSEPEPEAEPDAEPEAEPALESGPEQPASAVVSDGSMASHDGSPEHHSAPPPATLIETQTRALARLDGAVRRAWDAGLPSGDRLYVKSPFTSTEGSVEYLWVQVVSWRGSSIDGVLRSEPSWVTGLASGDVVALDQAAVFDYLWRRADGSSEGNETEVFLH
jgi:uncharacterized protein YegJ (DUF2314 family)